MARRGVASLTLLVVVLFTLAAYFSHGFWMPRLSSSLPLPNINSTDRHGVIPNDTEIILLYNDWFGVKEWFFGTGRTPFVKFGCEFDKCFITTDKRLLAKSTMVIFHAVGRITFPRKPIKGQRWVIAGLESPVHGRMAAYAGHVDLTMTYQRDSDIIMSYGLYRPRDTLTSLTPTTDRKAHGILWLVSHCGIKKRDDFVITLKSYTHVDVYGDCGKPCKPRSKCGNEFIQGYKFYLALENSQCKDYITEKFWRTLNLGVLPVVMGASMDDYTAVAPPDSFLHVDNFTSVQELADYLTYLEGDAEAYNKYFKWREKYEAQSYAFSIARAACQMCQIAHRKTTKLSPTAEHLTQWWRATEQCV